jgi:hypothetical protein
MTPELTSILARPLVISLELGSKKLHSRKKRSCEESPIEVITKNFFSMIKNATGQKHTY